MQGLSFLCILDSLEQKQTYTFGKEEKLKSRKQIEQLFREGKSISMYPLRLLWIPQNNERFLQCGVSVSSRHFKHAVDRNKIKRRMREAYRLNKHLLEQTLLEKNMKLSLFWIYSAKTILPFTEIESACISGIQKLMRQIK